MREIKRHYQTKVAISSGESWADVHESLTNSLREAGYQTERTNNGYTILVQETSVAGSFSVKPEGRRECIVDAYAYPKHPGLQEFLAGLEIPNEIANE
jgi:hypothetical protein